MNSESSKMRILMMCSRLWVFQEVALAPKSTCVIGDFSLDLLDVLKTASWLLWKPGDLPFSLRMTAGFRNAHDMWDYADRQNGQFGSDPSCRTFLSHLLIEAKGLKSSEPKDIVYGRLGLMDRARNGVNNHPLLIPDYQKSVPEVYRDASRYALKEVEDLSILSMSIVDRTKRWNAVDFLLGCLFGMSWMMDRSLRRSSHATVRLITE